MSTENNNKQTLFRFVSFRNPNLAETKETNLAFIQRSNNAQGVFDQVTVTNNQTKLKALLLEASVFETSAIKTVEELEKGELKELIKVGKAIAANSQLLPDELKLCKEEYVKNIDSATIVAIWDNLIYQYITQKDFYVKETLVYILKALHVGYVQTIEASEDLKKLNGEDFVKTAMNATIVIPSSILGKITTSSTKRVEKKELSGKETGLLTLGLEDFEKEQNSLMENGL